MAGKARTGQNLFAVALRILKGCLHSLTSFLYPQERLWKETRMNKTLSTLPPRPHYHPIWLTTGPVSPKRDRTANKTRRQVDIFLTTPRRTRGQMFMSYATCAPLSTSSVWKGKCENSANEPHNMSALLTRWIVHYSSVTNERTLETSPTWKLNYKK